MSIRQEGMHDEKNIYGNRWSDICYGHVCACINYAWENIGNPDKLLGEII